jgi:hypothetical protein
VSVRPLHVLIVGVWVAVLATGFTALARYDNTPGEMSAQAPNTWPQLSRLNHKPGLPTLIVMLHPRCSCSRATLENLARTMSRLKGQVHVDLVFVWPRGSEGWGEGDLFKIAKEIPDAEPFQDTSGREHKLFGALISGETFLYSREGSLVFHGGITDSRSHEGGNAGLDAVADFVKQGTAERSQTPVFGCALGPASAPQAGDSLQ